MVCTTPAPLIVAIEPDRKKHFFPDADTAARATGCAADAIRSCLEQNPGGGFGGFVWRWALHNELPHNGGP